VLLRSVDDEIFNSSGVLFAYFLIIEEFFNTHSQILYQIDSFLKNVNGFKEIIVFNLYIPTEFRILDRLVAPFLLKQGFDDVIFCVFVPSSSRKVKTLREDSNRLLLVFQLFLVSLDLGDIFVLFTCEGVLDRGDVFVLKQSF
jgi:hypothetical protein